MEGKRVTDIDKYDTNCPYNNKPCVGCGSLFTECPRCKVEKEEVEWMKKMEGDDECSE